jgi:uncharacterized protein YecE (DUF72 family)
MPNEALVAGWSEQTPEHFKLTLKAPKRITHDSRLRDCADATQRFLDVANTLGAKLGVLLFQLPPYLKKDVVVLDAFLETLPAGTRATFEFRHVSWLDDEVYGRLKAKGLALCVADSEKLSTPVEITADYAYFRLRDEGYQRADIERWARTIQEKTAGCQDVFVYFKHEEQGIGPEFARILMDALGVAKP